MDPSRKTRLLMELIITITVMFAVAIGIVLGLALADGKNLDITKRLAQTQLALPSQILDKNGKLITEYFAQEKRNVVSIDSLPKVLIYATVAAEDKNFFRHHGFDLASMIRAGWNDITGRYFSGGSTITQQTATVLFLNKSDKSIKRKLKELWYAFQLERTLTKYQILQLYLNSVYLGHATYGVGAASEFYFGHPASELTLAESAILVVQIRAPAYYSIINHPNRARNRQQVVLDQMVAQGYVTRKEADDSYTAFWDNYDATRPGSASAYFDNSSKAPYFTEYVRLQLENLLYGKNVDINREGFIVHTTLDLGIQEKAREIMDEGLKRGNASYRDYTQYRVNIADKRFLPLINMLALALPMPELAVSGPKKYSDAVNHYLTYINPVVDLVSLISGDSGIRNTITRAYKKQRTNAETTTVQGALITLDNSNGHILAMIGGSDFMTTQFNRAVNGTIQPGSSFKPLYYSAAISSRKFTPATILPDSPVVFYNPDGTPYTPMNFIGEWTPPIPLRYALAHSMNVPSTEVFAGVGFDAAIDRATRMLGMYDKRNDEKLFPRKYPLALGVVSVAPLNMARAYATFPDQGRAVDPIAITYVEDRQGNIILNHEKDVINQRQHESQQQLQIMSPQVAYIMVSLLQSVTSWGTLAWASQQVGGYDGMPMAGKTGTTDNWSNAWTVGFSPYMTTAMWFGFDIPGESLGRWQTGATLTGPLWAEYMKDINSDLPIKQFAKPETGLITRKIDDSDGLLYTPGCSGQPIDEIFLTGTEPTKTCASAQAEVQQKDSMGIQKLQDKLMLENYNPPGIDFSNLKPTQSNGTSSSGSSGSGKQPASGGNPLLD